MLLVLSDAFTDGRVLQPAVMHYSMDGGEKFLKRRMQSVFNRVTFRCTCSAAHWSDLSRSHQRATLNASDVMRKNYTFCLRSILFSLWMATRCVLKALDVTLKNLTLRKKKKKRRNKREICQGEVMRRLEIMAKVAVLLQPPVCPLICSAVLTGCVRLFRDQRCATPVSARTLREHSIRQD